MPKHRVAPIRAYLKKNGLSQQAFADRLLVSQGLVWQWLDHRTEITARRAKQIEQATGGDILRADLRPDIFG
jgi:DNA-binding transcriptional regulator YdaS (Cro superfamily)